MNIDIQQSIAFNATIDTIIKLCSISKEMRENCTQDWFWIELYNKYNIPTFDGIKYDDTFNGYLSHFIHSYNSMLFARYLSKKHSFDFNLNYIYNESGKKVLSQLNQLDIDYKLPHLEVNTSDKLIVLSEDDIEYFTTDVLVEKNNSHYSISLNLLYEKQEFFIQNITSLTYQELVHFLYGLVNTDELSYVFMKKFCSYYYQEHKAICNLPL